MSRTLRLVGTGILSTIALVACSPKKVGPPDPASFVAPCDRWVADLADQSILLDALLAPGLVQAGPVHVPALGPDDRALVVAAYARACVVTASAVGSGVTPEWLDACRTALVARAPSDKAIPPSCSAPQGTLDDGSACATDFLCASGRCSGTARPYLTACGTCAAPLQKGELCSRDRDCAGGLACVGTPGPPGTHGPGSAYCQPASGPGAPPSVPPDPPPSTAKLGDPCTGYECGNDLHCSDPAGGQCVAALPLGAKCAAGYQCSSAAWCDDSNVCAARLSQGTPCNSSDYACAAGLKCADDCAIGGQSCQADAAPPPSAPGTPALRGICAIGAAESCQACPAVVPDGGACDTQLIRPLQKSVCLPRSTCDNGTCRPDPIVACGAPRAP
jgi:hypothetical protein